MEEKRLNHIRNRKNLFKEQYLVFQEGAEELLEKAAENFLNVASKLLETVNTIAEKSLSAIDYTGAYAVKAGRKIEGWMVGKPEDLSEYSDMDKYFEDPLETIKNLSSDSDESTELYETLKDCPDLDVILLSHTKIAFLNLRIAQVKKFIEPALIQFQIVEQELNKIRNLRGISTMHKLKGGEDYRLKVKELENEIKRISLSIDESEFPADHPQQTDRDLLLKKKRSELEVLKQKLAIEGSEDLNKDSVVVGWPSVFLVPTKFPPSEPIKVFGWTFSTPQLQSLIIDRVVFNNSYKQSTDINELYKYLQSYLNPYKEDLEKYSEEIDKLAYRRDTLMADATAGLNSKDANEYAKAKKLDEAFKKAFAKIKEQSEKAKKSAGNYPPAGDSKNIEDIIPDSTTKWKPGHDSLDGAF